MDAAPIDAWERPPEILGKCSQDIEVDQDQ
jgi:hypothetical protein